MGLIQRIKQFFTRNKIQALPENASTSNYSDNSWILNSSSGNSQKQFSKLDLDIQNFLNKYSQTVASINSDQPINNFKVAYASLVSSNEQITQEQYIHNLNRENELLTNFAFNNMFQVNEQGGFYHIRSQNYKMPNFDEMARVYINCKSENIAELANEISDTNTNPNFYMKFTSNESNAQNPRNEKIVIYCNKNEVDYTINLLQYCKSIKPELFADSKTFPFLKNEQNIASTANQPLTNLYTNLYGQTTQIPQSVNSFITNMLQEAYMEAAREIARADKNLDFLLDPNYYNNETLYVQNYPYISHCYNDYLLNSMKAKLEILSRSNHIEIDGLNPMQQYNKEYTELYKYDNYNSIEQEK